MDAHDNRTVGLSVPYQLSVHGAKFLLFGLNENKKEDSSCNAVVQVITVHASRFLTYVPSLEAHEFHNTMFLHPKGRHVKR